MSKEEPCHLDDEWGADGGKGIQFPSIGYELWVPDKEEGWRQVGPKIKSPVETCRRSRTLYAFPNEAARAAVKERARHDAVRIVAVSFRVSDLEEWERKEVEHEAPRCRNPRLTSRVAGPLLSARLLLSEGSAPPPAGPSSFVVGAR